MFCVKYFFPDQTNFLSQFVHKFWIVHCTKFLQDTDKAQKSIVISQMPSNIFGALGHRGDATKYV